MSDKIVISKEKRKAMIELIQTFLLKERDEDLGKFSVSIILSYFAQELAPEFYNQGVSDSYAYMNGKLEDLFGLQIYKP